jgi:hypothetical protein
MTRPPPAFVRSACPTPRSDGVIRAELGPGSPKTPCAGQATSLSFLAVSLLASSALHRPAARTSRDAVPGAGTPPGPGTFALYIYGRPADGFLQP